MMGMWHSLEEVRNIKKEDESGQHFLCHLYVEKVVAVKMFAVDWR